MPYEKLAFVSSRSENALAACAELKAMYPNVAPEEADVIVALGGDGYMLEAMHRSLRRGTPIYGMNRGTVGFLMNGWEHGELLNRLARAKSFSVKPLTATVTTVGGQSFTLPAINEVSLLPKRGRPQKSRLR